MPASCTDDADCDTVPDSVDNCPSVSNPDQLNTDAGNTVLRLPDADTIGDACDTDIDGDGYVNPRELTANRDAKGYCAIMRADLNPGAQRGNGIVNSLDLLNVALAFGPLTGDGRENQDGNTLVNSIDLLIIALRFNQTIASCPPAQPDDIAPPIDETVATDIATSTAFLYTGSNPIQTGVAPDTIELTRAAVLRGKVLNRSDVALPGVKIAVLNHPEFGETMSRADGMFDLAVNGGGTLTIEYTKTGFLPAQRQVQVPWQDYAHVPDVVLIALDAKVSPVNLSAATPIQVAQADPVTDSDGTRTATLLFSQGTTATANGIPITNLSIRATEYTVGANGPEAMPAALPPTSGYTYAVEFSADEAMGQNIQFSQPVYNYVDNFLIFPVGTIVPVGYYDRAKAAWIPSDNGRVIKILSITGGSADLDVTGDGVTDTGATLTELGVTQAERQTLATLYAAGKSLWRVPVMHFSTYDHNFGTMAEPGATAPQVPALKDTAITKPVGDPTCVVGSIIECENQVLRESIGIAGTSFSLNYRSDRTSGRTDSYSADITLSGPSVPAQLRRISLEVEFAGRVFNQVFPPNTGQTYRFTWDGKNAYGQRIVGAVPVTVRVGYVYGSVYQLPAFLARSFGSVSGIPLAPAREETTLWQTTKTTLGTLGAAIDGWNLSPHHAYDPTEKVLYLGDGTRRDSEALRSTFVINTEAGNGLGIITGGDGDGGPATLARLGAPTGVALAPDGTYYIADPGANRIRRVLPDGTISTFAGTGVSGFSGDGGPANLATLFSPMSVAVAPDGSLFIADNFNNRVRRVGPDGIITTVAGTGFYSFGGDGGPATQAFLRGVRDVDVQSDGSLLVVDSGNYRIRRVGVDGIITTVAGNGALGGSNDGMPASQAAFGPFSVSAATDGSFYISSTSPTSVYRVGPNGIITRIAGTGVAGFSGDGGPARDAQLDAPIDALAAPNGDVFISDWQNGRVRRIGPDGKITTVAGGGSVALSSDGVAATRVVFVPRGLAMAANGDLFVAVTGNRRVVRLGSTMPSLASTDIVLASVDGSELYIFSGTGRHLRTLDALTAAMRYEFGYDSAGRLVTITDADANVTTVVRDGAGVPTAIVGPFGQLTSLNSNNEGYLTSVTNPADENVQLGYASGGLLVSLEDPRNGTHEFSYDSLGHLIRDEDQAGGFKTLSRNAIANGYEVSVTTALGRTTTYAVEGLPTGGMRRTVTDPSGAKTETTIGTDGSQTTTYADGTVDTLTYGPDLRWGMQAPIVLNSTRTTPGGRILSTSETQTVSLANTLDPFSLQSVTDTFTVNSRTSRRVYTASTRTLVSTSAANRVTTDTLDTRGRVVRSQVTGLAPIAYTYDARGRLSTVTEGTAPTQRTTTFSYGLDGFLAGATDPLGRTTANTYDAAGRVISQTLPGGRSASFTFDENSNVTGVAPPGKPLHVFDYTPNNLVANYSPPELPGGEAPTGYAYNSDGQPTQITQPDATVLEFAYDDGGRPSAMSLPRGDTGFSYDSAGRLAGMTAPGGLSASFSYDGGLLTSTTGNGPVAGTIGATYDSSLRVASLSVNGVNPIAVAYNNDDKVTTAGSLSLTRNTQTGLLTGSSIATVIDARTYDTFGEPLTYTASRSGVPQLGMQYTRDALGRITTRIETIAGITDTYDYSYDPAGRLATVRRNGIVVEAYTYDLNGNRLTSTLGANPQKSAAYDDQDRLSQYGGNSYSYAATGTLASKTIGGLTTTYEYDQLGNLMEATLAGGPTIQYLVDAQNRRVGKKVNGTLTQGFLYQSQLQPIAELDGSGAVISRFVYATKVNVPDYMIRAGVIYRLITDQVGSPRLVLDAATGAVLQRMDYDAFGNVIVDTNPGFQPFGFAGGLYDVDTKLVRFGARDYGPESGRWTAKDPIGFAGGDTNLYSYADADPVNNIDPTGLAVGRSVARFLVRAVAFRIFGAEGLFVGFGPDNGSYDERDPGNRNGGCGDAKTGGIIPDSIGRASFSAACKAHDIAYGRCSDRAAADAALRKGVKSALEGAGYGYLRSAAVANIYWLGVRLGGGGGYDATCPPKRKIPCEAPHIPYGTWILH